MTGGKVENGNDKKKDVKKPDEKERNKLKGRDPLGGVNFDYGNASILSEPSETTFDKTIRFYGGGKKEPTFQEQLFGRPGKTYRIQEVIPDGFMLNAEKADEFIEHLKGLEGMGETIDRSFITEHAKEFVEKGFLFALPQRPPTFQEQLFGGGYLGTYETPEGRFLHHTIGIRNKETLLKAFLGLRSDERVIKRGQTIEVGDYKLTYQGVVNEPKEAVMDIKNKLTAKEVRTTVCPGLEAPIGLSRDAKWISVTVSKCSETEVTLTIRVK